MEAIKQSVGVGHTSGFLTVLGATEQRLRRNIVWECLCECGSICYVPSNLLRNKEKKSCGCKTKAETSGTHGWYGTPTHNTWRTMKDRCLSPKHKSYKYYGGKGITICDRWLQCFENFLEDMGERLKGNTLARVDNTKGFYKENCYWSVKRNFSYDVVVVNPLSPSGLSWVTGEVAGSKVEGGYWKVCNPHRFVHRVVWELTHGKIPKGFMIDHIDGNPANNLISNLRLVNHRQNMLNRKIGKNNKTGVTGVFTLKRNKEVVGYQVIGVETKSGTKTFFFSIHGVEGAFKLACLAKEANMTEERKIYSRKPN